MDILKYNNTIKVDCHDIFQLPGEKGKFFYHLNFKARNIVQNNYSRRKKIEFDEDLTMKKYIS